ncbi:MAG: PAC2 family protein [Actinomycetales bacterium]|nr:PAC2 family protein [Actinomycetales bacterium]
MVTCNRWPRAQVPEEGACSVDVPPRPTSPPLRDPVLIAAFEGWNDAGEAASTALRHLISTWGAVEVADIDPEEFYDFQVNRPQAEVVDGTRVVTWPTTRLFAARVPQCRHDFILVDGIEPSTRWRSYTRQVLDLATDFGVSTVITLGAYLANVPHTRPIPITTTADTPAARERWDAEVSDYEGPTGIVGVLGYAASLAGMDAVACWAAIPYYAGGPPSPLASAALIHRLESVLDITIPSGDLEAAGRDWVTGVDELAESDDEIADYVSTLEEQSDSVELIDGSGDQLAREFERYLRRRDEG